MIAPSYFKDKDEEIQEYYYALEFWIISYLSTSMFDSLNVPITQKLINSKVFKFQKEFTKKVKSIMPSIKKALSRELVDAVKTSYKQDKEVFKMMGTEISDFSKNKEVLKNVNRDYSKALKELENLTHTTMINTSENLIEMMNKQVIAIQNGKDVVQATCDIIDNYARNGVMIDYPTGCRRTLESAVRCCLVTTTNQMTANVTNKLISDNNVEYVLVSAHLGARHSKYDPMGIPSHDWWQGKVYKIHGEDKDTPNLLKCTGYDIDTKNGLGKVVDPQGLHGFNCRHSHQAWSKGLDNPYLDKDGNVKIDLHESQEAYKISQVQRKLERDIRQTRREIVAKNVELSNIPNIDSFDKVKSELETLISKHKGQVEKYDSFVKKNGLTTSKERLATVGFNNIN